MDAISTDQAVKAGSDCGNGVLRFAENPDLDHVSGFTIVGRSGEARRDHDTVLIIVDDVAVAHREPPIDSMRATMAMMSAKPRMARGPWYLGGMRSFMV